MAKRCTGVPAGKGRAKLRGDSAASRSSVSSCEGAFSPKRLALLLALAYGASSGMALANPQGGQVVSGSATIVNNGPTTTVTNTPGAIINWQSFSIGRGETTNFIQQHVNSAVLNRVVGQDPSSILGNLTSNGRVFLINPNGVVFGQGAMVDTAGLVVSTLRITDDDFKAGRMRFVGSGTSGDLKIAGVVRSSSGDIYLIAPNIENTGAIQAQNGNAILAAGEKVEILSRGLDGITFEVQNKSNQARNLGRIEGNAVGMFAGSIRQGGEVTANSVGVVNGRIVLRAKGDITLAENSRTQADNAAGKGGTVTVRSQTGDVRVESGATVSASGVQGGLVTLQADLGTNSVSGLVQATGTLALASAPDALPAKGGTVQLLGRQVGVFDQARIDASGDQGGGTVLVGGDWQGANPDIQNARASHVGADARISAESRINGDGGTVVVWADEYTAVHGEIDVRGGTEGGAGGQVETSGKKLLEVTHAPLLHSRAGEAGGVWLLDPTTINIINGTSSAGTTGSSPFGPTDFSGNDESDINVNLIISALELGGGSTVEVRTEGVGTTGVGAGDINVNAPILFNGGGGAVLNLNATRDINVNQNIEAINTTSGSLDVNLAANLGGAGGGVSIAASRSIITRGGSVSVNGDSFVNLGTVDTSGRPGADGGAIQISLSTLGSISTVVLDAGILLANGGNAADGGTAGNGGNIGLSVDGEGGIRTTRIESQGGDGTLGGGRGTFGHGGDVTINGAGEINLAGPVLLGGGDAAQDESGAPGGDGGSLSITSQLGGTVTVGTASDLIDLSGGRGGDALGGTGFGSTWLAGDGGAGGTLTINTAGARIVHEVQANGGAGGDALGTLTGLDSSVTVIGGAGGAGGRLDLSWEGTLEADDATWNFDGGAGGKATAEGGRTRGGAGGAGGVVDVPEGVTSIDLKSVTVQARGGAGGDSGGGGSGLGLVGSAGGGGAGGNINLSAQLGVTLTTVSLTTSGGAGGSVDDSSAATLVGALGGAGGNSGTVYLQGDTLSLSALDVNARGGDGGMGGRAQSGTSGDGGAGGGGGYVSFSSSSGLSLTNSSSVDTSGGSGGAAGSATGLFTGLGQAGQGGTGGAIDLFDSIELIISAAQFTADGGAGGSGGDHTNGTGSLSSLGGDGGMAGAIQIRTNSSSDTSVSLTDVGMRSFGGDGGQGGNVGGDVTGQSSGGAGGAGGEISVFAGGNVTINNVSGVLIESGGGRGGDAGMVTISGFGSGTASGGAGGNASQIRVDSFDGDIIISNGSFASTGGDGGAGGDVAGTGVSLAGGAGGAGEMVNINASGALTIAQSADVSFTSRGGAGGNAGSITAGTQSTSANLDGGAGGSAEGLRFYAEDGELSFGGTALSQGGDGGTGGSTTGSNLPGVGGNGGAAGSVQMESTFANLKIAGDASLIGGVGGEGAGGVGGEGGGASRFTLSGMTIELASGELRIDNGASGTGTAANTSVNESTLTGANGITQTSASSFKSDTQSISLNIASSDGAVSLTSPDNQITEVHGYSLGHFAVESATDMTVISSGVSSITSTEGWVQLTVNDSLSPTASLTLDSDVTAGDDQGILLKANEIYSTPGISVSALGAQGQVQIRPYTDTRNMLLFGGGTGVDGSQLVVSQDLLNSIDATVLRIGHDDLPTLTLGGTGLIQMADVSVLSLAGQNIVQTQALRVDGLNVRANDAQLTAANAGSGGGDMTLSGAGLGSAPALTFTVAPNVRVTVGSNTLGADVPDGAFQSQDGIQGYNNVTLNTDLLDIVETLDMAGGAASELIIAPVTTYNGTAGNVITLGGTGLGLSLDQADFDNIVSAGTVTISGEATFNPIVVAGNIDVSHLTGAFELVNDATAAEPASGGISIQGSLTSGGDLLLRADGAATDAAARITTLASGAARLSAAGDLTLQAANGLGSAAAPIIFDTVGGTLTASTEFAGGDIHLGTYGDLGEVTSASISTAVGSQELVAFYSLTSGQTANINAVLSMADDALEVHSAGDVVFGATGSLSAATVGVFAQGSITSLNTTTAVVTSTSTADSSIVLEASNPTGLGTLGSASNPLRLAFNDASTFDLMTDSPGADGNMYIQRFGGNLEFAHIGAVEYDELTAHHLQFSTQTGFDIIVNPDGTADWGLSTLELKTGGDILFNQTGLTTLQGAALWLTGEASSTALVNQPGQTVTLNTDLTAMIPMEVSAGSTVNLDGSAQTGEHSMTRLTNSGTFNVTGNLGVSDLELLAGSLNGAGGNLTVSDSFSQSAGALLETGWDVIDITQLNGDVSLQKIAANTVNIDVQDGALVDGNAAGVNIQAPDLDIQASGAVNTDLDAARARVVSGASIDLSNVGALELVGIDAVGNFTYVGNGDLTQSGVVNVSGTTTLTNGTGLTTLTDGNNFFGDTLSVDGAGNIDIASNQALRLGAVSGDADARFRSGQDGSVTDAGIHLTGLVNVGGDLTLEAGNSVDNMGARITSEMSGASLTAGGSITLAAGNGIGAPDAPVVIGTADSIGATTHFAGGDIHLGFNGALPAINVQTASGSQELVALYSLTPGMTAEVNGDIDASGDSLELHSQGAVRFGASGSLTGETVGVFALGSITSLNTSGAVITANSSGLSSITLVADNPTGMSTLGDASNPLRLAFNDASSFDLSTNGVGANGDIYIQRFNGDLHFAHIGEVNFDEASAHHLQFSTASGYDIVVNPSGGLADFGNLNTLELKTGNDILFSQSGTTTLQGGRLLLNGEAGSVARINVSGQTVNLNTDLTANLTVDVSSDTTVNLDGSAQTGEHSIMGLVNSGTFNVTGNLGVQDLELLGGSLNGAGGNLTVSNSFAQSPGALLENGWNLIDITQTSGDVSLQYIAANTVNINVQDGALVDGNGSATNIGASGVSIMASGNIDADLDTSLITAISTSGSISLSNAGPIEFVAISAGENFVFEGNGDITQSGAVNVSGTTTLVNQSGSITLGNFDNRFDGTLSMNISGPGNILVASDGALSLGNVVVEDGTLALAGGAGISQVSESSIQQSGGTGGTGLAGVTLVSQNGSILLGNFANRFGAPVSAAAQDDILINTSSELTLDQVIAGGFINISASAIDVANLVSGQFIELAAIGTSDGEGDGELGLLAANGGLSIWEGATVTGQTVLLTSTADMDIQGTVYGSTAVVAQAGGNMYIGGNNISGVNGSISGGDISLNSSGNMDIQGTVNASGMVIAEAGGNMFIGGNNLSGVSGGSISGDSVYLNSSGNMDIQGTVFGSTLVLAQADGSMMVGGNNLSGVSGISGGSVGLISGGDMEIQTNVSGSQSLLLMSGGDMRIGGSNPAGSTSVYSGGEMTIVSLGDLDIVGGSADGAFTSVASESNAFVDVNGTLRILGGSGSGAFAVLDPLQPGTDMVISSGNILLQGGPGAGAYAAIISQGDIFLDSPGSIDLVYGLGPNADSVVIAPNGTIFYNGVCSPWCVYLGADPLSDPITQIGFYDSNGFPPPGFPFPWELIDEVLGQVIVLWRDRHGTPIPPPPDIVLPDIQIPDGGLDDC